MISKKHHEYSIHFLKTEDKTKQLKNALKSPFPMVQLQTTLSNMDRVANE